MTCDFCSNEIFAIQEIFEGKFSRVLFPRDPVIARHFLLIPIRHVRYSHELNSNELTEIFSLQGKIYEYLKSNEGCNGYNFFVNNGGKAGQEIAHCHFHFFARYQNEKESPFALLTNGQREKLTPGNYRNNIRDLRLIFARLS